MTFEDLRVSAYNGGGVEIKNPEYLAVAGSIVSVEARHAGTIRNILDSLSGKFADRDVVDGSGLDVSRKPSAVLRAAKPFINTPITAYKLP